LYYLCKKRPDLELIRAHRQHESHLAARRGAAGADAKLHQLRPALWLEAGEAKTDFLARARDAVKRLKELE